MNKASFERIVGRSLVGWRASQPASMVGVIFAYGLLAATILLALCIFIARPTEPFGYWRDIGFAHETAAGAVFSLHSWTDVVDAIGWTPWYNAPLFILNSNVSEAIITAVAWLSGDAWLAVKIVQVLEAIVAFCAAFAMYATYSKSKLWAAVFGFSYAALPATALGIRGNPAIGWLLALAPGAIALGTLLMRRYGARAVPFIGFLCAAVGYGIALEYALFSSIPLFALIVAGERRRITMWAWLTLVPLGLLCCVAMGAFYVLPSFDAPIVSDAAARTVSLSAGAFLVNFSETLPGLLTLIPREAYVSTFPDYNVESALPFLFVFGSLVWAAALANLRWNAQRRACWTDLPALLVVTTCLILAMGTAVPFGQNLWSALFAIPHVNAIRTPDRFLLLPSVMLTFWYVCGLELVGRTYPWSRQIAGWASLCIVLAFISFDISQHCFAVEPTLGIRQPEIEPVRRIVEAEGGKTASFAGVNGGFSFDEASEYGVPEPLAPAAQDLGGRFLEDGNGAVGVLGRMGTRTVISAPNWTLLGTFPNTSNIYRRLTSAPVIFKSNEDVLVSRLTARDDVSSPTAICVYGGPGGFDLLENAVALRGTAFLETDSGCRTSGLVNFDPRDIRHQRSTIEAWSGSELLPAAGKILDNDYSFVPNRSLLNVPWYRNSIDGDRPVFNSNGAIEVGALQGLILPSKAEWPTGTTIAIRISSRSAGTVAINAGPAFVGSIRVVPAQGFRWYEVRTTAPKPKDALVTLDLAPGLDTVATGWVGFALDGVDVYNATSATDVPIQRPTFVAISVNRFSHESEQLKSTILAPSEVGASGAVANAMHYDTFQTAPVWLADAATSQLRFPWRGPTGLYIIHVQAVLTNPGDTVGLAVDRGPNCCVLTASYGSGFSGALEGRFRLHRGSQIVIRVVSPAFTFASANRITGVEVKPAGVWDLATKSSTGSSGTIDFAQSVSDSLAQLTVTRGVHFEPPLAYGTAGSRLTASAILSGDPTSASLEIVKVGQGFAQATLKCDRAPVQEKPLFSDDTVLAVSGSGFRRCSVRIDWSSGNVGLRLIRLIVGGASLPEGTADIWMPKGRYAVSILQADGSVLRRPRITSVGCLGKNPICTFPVAARHYVRLSETPTAGRLLVFTSLEHVDRPAGIIVQKTAALRWRVALAKRSTIALTQIYDGNWILSDASHTYTGQRCDISNTCFTGIMPGRYNIYHRWPVALRAGVAITSSTLIVTLLIMFIRIGRSKRTAIQLGA